MPEPPRKVNLVAEQSLSQAHMHLALDERDQALAMARKALAEEPGFPAAAILAAYLAAAAETNPRELRALLSMIDKALGREPSCRRGNFYRAELRKRLGDHKGAVEDLRLAVRNDPDDAEAARELRVYERKIEAGTVKLDGEAEAPKSIRFLDRLRGK
jgi:tetratricopeptide (TPR) repeat protein